MLNESTRTHWLLNLAHLRKVAALYGPEEAKKVAAVFKTISLLSSFSASADTLNALAVSLARKNLNGNSGAQILTMTSNEFATLAVGAVSKDEKRRLKLSLNAIVASKCDLQADVYPMWVAAREMRKIDAAASQGDLLRALYDAKGDVDARIVDALVTNEFTRYFIIRLLRIDDKARDAESVAEALKAAVAGFIAGLPHFFEALAIPEVLTAAPVALAAVTGGLPTVPAVSEAAAHPPVTSAAPTSAAAAPRRSRAPAQPPITAAAPTSAAAAISAQPPVTAAAPTSDGTIVPHGSMHAGGTGGFGDSPSTPYAFCSPAGYGFSTPAGGAIPQWSFGDASGFGGGHVATVELPATAGRLGGGGAAPVPVTADDLANLLGMIAVGQMAQSAQAAAQSAHQSAQIAALTAEISRLAALPASMPKGSPERNVRAEVLTMFDTLNSTLRSNQEQLNTTLEGLSDKLDTNGAAVQGSFASSTSLILLGLESAKKETVDAVESGRSAVLSAIDVMAQSAHLDREAAHLDREAARDSAHLDRESNTANLMLAIQALRPAAHGPSAASASRANMQPTTPRQATGVCTFARPTQCACRQAPTD